MFVPNYRKKILVGKIKERLANLIQAYPDQQHLKILAMEIIPDHIHLFLNSAPCISSSQIVHDIKGQTSSILRQVFPFLKRHQTLWFRSYFVGSSGNVSLRRLKSTLKKV
ncbi:MAG: IS200/IS605 family transposase, partial [Promethearchaeota archaeon]